MQITNQKASLELKTKKEDIVCVCNQSKIILVINLIREVNIFQQLREQKYRHETEESLDIAINIIL